MRRRSAVPRLQGETLGFMQRLWALAHALEVRSKRMARTIGVTGPQRLVIRLVGQRPDSSATELAQALGVHPSTLTGILARLQRDKLIERKTPLEDRRRAAFRLTAAGHAIDRERKGTVEAAVRTVIGRLDPEVVAHAEELLVLLAAELLDEK